MNFLGRGTPTARMASAARPARHLGSRHNIRAVILLAIIILPLSVCLSASERWYADEIADAIAGRTEVRMRDGSRCDILTSTHAIEVDFARKWAEAIGQSLLYASQTGKPGAIALIVESPADERFVKRLSGVIAWHRLPIGLLIVRPLNRTTGIEIKSNFILPAKHTKTTK